MSEDIKAGMERFKLALERIKAGRSESEDVELSTGRVRLTPDEDAPTGVRIQPLREDSDEVAMPKVDPQRREAMEQMHQALERVRSGESESEEVVSPEGDIVRIDRDPDVPGALIIRHGEEGGVVRTLSFQAASARPLHYPVDLPFLPDCGSGLTEMGEVDTRTLTWFGPSKPETRVQEIASQLTALGWETGERSRASTHMGTVEVMGFRKDGRLVDVRVSQFGNKLVISLMEHPEKDSEE